MAPADASGIFEHFSLRSGVTRPRRERGNGAPPSRGVRSPVPVQAFHAWAGCSEMDRSLNGGKHGDAIAGGLPPHAATRARAHRILALTSRPE
jgi:hypothetical protein